MTNEEIEQINKLTPFTHSTWQGKGITVTSEGRQSGRAKFMAERVRETILKHFSLKDLENMTITDVGCYDGWILYELQDLPFKKLVGIEPRKRNIEKGEKIREMLGIESRVSFVQAGIGNLPMEKYDIVLCLGVFHHLECIACATKELAALAKSLLIIETIVLPSKLITEEMKEYIEIKDKDPIYKYVPPMCGVIGQKYESAVNDGYAAEPSVVSIPSAESILMYLDMLGYKADIVANPDDFKRAMTKYTRPSYETMIAAVKQEKKDWKKIFEDHELKRQETILPRPLVMQLLRDQAVPAGFKTDDPIVQDILKDIPYAPEDQINLEYAKLLLHEGKTEEGNKILRSITQKLDADWRSCHRAFKMLGEF